MNSNHSTLFEFSNPKKVVQKCFQAIETVEKHFMAQIVKEMIRIKVKSTRTAILCELFSLFSTADIITKKEKDLKCSKYDDGTIIMVINEIKGQIELDPELGKIVLDNIQVINIYFKNYSFIFLTFFKVLTIF